jgi:mannose-6-phosphate isomerase-like protein (cupin superfamily)
MSFRRVITGKDRNNKSFIEIDSKDTKSQSPIPMMPSLKLYNFWETKNNKVIASEFEDITVSHPCLSVIPENNGTIFRYCVFPPEEEFIDSLKNISESELNVLKNDLSIKFENTKHPLMHEHNTIDYAIVISGEITLVLDSEETLLKAGDVVIQRATNHAWSNRSKLDCTVAFILIDNNTVK